MAMPGERPGKGGPDDYESRVRDEMARGLERRYYQSPPTFQALVGSLQQASKGETDEAKEARKEIEPNWRKVMQTVLHEEDELLDDRLLRFKNVVPYDIGDLKYLWKGLRSGIRTAREEVWAGPEAQAWIDRVTVDTEWARANALLLEGMSGVLDKMYDIDQMLNWVRERFREDPIQNVYQRTFDEGKDEDGEGIPGLVVLPESRPFLGVRAEMGLREKAIKFHSDATWARITGAAAASYDPDNPADPDRLKKKLTSAELVFFQTLLRNAKKSADGWVNYKAQNGTTYRMPEAMLNWNSMPSIDKYKRKYVATMQAIILTNARERLEKLEKPDGSYDAAGMKTLVTEIEERRKAILKIFFSDKRDLDTQLAGVVVKSGIVFDWGEMPAAPMSRAWVYKPSYAPEDKEKKTIIGWEKRPTAGPITTATDSNTGHYWLWNFLDSMNKGWPAGIFPRASDEYIKRGLSNSPEWRPGYDFKNHEYPNKLTLKEAWSMLAEQQKAWDPRVMPWLKTMCWAWETKCGAIPIFMPSKFNSVNFRETITLAAVEETPVIKEINTPAEFPSLWDQQTAGEDTRKIKWENMGDQAFYRWLITLGQLYRVYITMKEPGGEQAKEFLARRRTPITWRSI